MHYRWFTGQVTIVAPVMRAGTVTTSPSHLYPTRCIRNRGLLADCDFMRE